MEPWLSWTIVLGAAAAFWWLYRGDKKALSTRPRSVTDPTPPKKLKTPKPQRKSISTTSSDIGEKVAAVPEIVKSAVYDSSDKDDASDRLWADRMNNARKGTNLSVPSRDSKRTKTVKVSKAVDFSSASSSTGADADDDMTPAVSPLLKAEAGDVSDMLEPKAPGPSVLRLTEDPNAPPPRAPRPQKEFQVAETKKQRQNRRKNEERKAANQETEQERQALLEKQRRAAREARGEPAKNGLQQAKAPAQSAWTEKGTTSTPSQQATRVDSGSYTYSTSEGSTKTAGINNAPTNGYAEGEPSAVALQVEEEIDGWNTVATKKGKKQRQPSDNSKPALQAAATKTTTASNGYASLQSDD